MKLSKQSTLESLADRVHEHRIGGCRLLTLYIPVESVVTIRGSFMSFPELGEADEDLLQTVTTSLLDKGTKLRDRFAVAELLEDRGAQLEFSSDGLYVDISGRALKEDVPEVLELLAEQLKEPLFDPDEVEKAKARVGASIQRSMENTASQATGALTRTIYPSNHPNFTPTPEARLEHLTAIDESAIRSYHNSHFGSNAFTLIAVGDIDEVALTEAVQSHFEDWGEHGTRADYASSGLRTEPERSMVAIPEKQNVDVRLGHALTIRRDEPDYVPAYLTSYILGGNFSARLMQKIRDEMGLTYGIRAGLYGITTKYSGHWHVSVTLSQENVERGLEATADELTRFVEEGVSRQELSEKQTTIVGSFKVGLATTSGMAATLLKNAERGFDVDYLDRFPDEVESVTLERANEVVKEHFEPARLHTALAGDLPQLYALND